MRLKLAIWMSIDFAGKIDDKSVQEVAPEAKSISNGTDFWIQSDDERFLRRSSRLSRVCRSARARKSRSVRKGTTDRGASWQKGGLTK
jgi:hypothetical protein